MIPSAFRRLLAARELVVVDLADSALRALVLALELEHPTLDEPTFTSGPPTLRRARSVVRLVHRLCTELQLYRRAVDDALATPAVDDIPF